MQLMQGLPTLPGVSGAPADLRAAAKASYVEVGEVPAERSAGGPGGGTAGATTDGEPGPHAALDIAAALRLCSLFPGLDGGQVREIVVSTGETVHLVHLLGDTDRAHHFIHLALPRRRATLAGAQQCIREWLRPPSPRGLPAPSLPAQRLPAQRVPAPSLPTQRLPIYLPAQPRQSHVVAHPTDPRAAPTGPLPVLPQRAAAPRIARPPVMGWNAHADAPAPPPVLRRRWADDMGTLHRVLAGLRSLS